MQACLQKCPGPLTKGPVNDSYVLSFALCDEPGTNHLSSAAQPDVSVSRNQLCSNKLQKKNAKTQRNLSANCWLASYATEISYEAAIKLAKPQNRGELDKLTLQRVPTWSQNHLILNVEALVTMQSAELALLPTTANFFMYFSRAKKINLRRDGGRIQQTGDRMWGAPLMSAGAQ